MGRAIPVLILVAACLSLSACGESLKEARKGFTTHLMKKQSEGDAPEQPPADLFRLTTYPSPLGDMAAYVSPSPNDGKKHPAIIWLIGGFSNGIHDTPWQPASSQNDQSASAYREAGIIMMYPSRRGGNTNPGYREDFLGEADDIIAARDYLAKLDYVDPNRIYLGGHSTGGTLALIVAELDNKFRAVFAFGPVDDVSGYGSDILNYDLSNPKETNLRSPIKWLQDIGNPTYVLKALPAPAISCV